NNYGRPRSKSGRNTTRASRNWKTWLEMPRAGMRCVTVLRYRPSPIPPLCLTQTFSDGMKMKSKTSDLILSDWDFASSGQYASLRHMNFPGTIQIKADDEGFVIDLWD